MVSCAKFGTVSLDFYGDWFRECEAKDGLGKQDDLFVPGVCRCRGYGTRTRRCPNEVARTPLGPWSLVRRVSWLELRETIETSGSLG